MRARAGLKRTSRAEVTGRAYDRYFGVTLRAIKAGRTLGAALLASVGVVVPIQTLHCAAGSIPAVRPCIAHSATGYIHRSRYHCPAGADVPARALTKLPITRLRNTSTVTRGTPRGGIAHNARHQSVSGWSVPAMYVVGCCATSADAPERLERHHNSER